MTGRERDSPFDSPAEAGDGIAQKGDQVTEIIIRTPNSTVVPTDRGMEVTITNPSTISEAPTDYVLGLVETVEEVERLLLRGIVEATGVYVREALDDRGDARCPLSIRAERFSLSGAIYRSTQRDFFPQELGLDRQTIYEMAVHYIGIAARCIRLDMDWPSRTIRELSGNVTVWASLDQQLDDIQVDGGLEGVMAALALVSCQMDRILAELEEHERVLSPWQFGEKTRHHALRLDWQSKPRPSWRDHLRGR